MKTEKSLMSGFAPSRQHAEHVYGKSKEACYVAGHEFERLCDDILTLLKNGGWREVGAGFDNVRDFLRSYDLTPFNMDAKRALAKEIKKLEPKVSNRALADMAGVGSRTIDRDVAAPNGALEEGVTQEETDSVAPNGALTGRETAELARRKEEREQARADRESLPPPEIPKGKFRVIYADPPWQYNDERRSGGGAESVYPTISTDDLCEIPVNDRVHTDAVLFLWATSPMLPDALRVMEAWGFEYKASFVWDKVRGFYGHYNDVRHELLLIGTKGSCLPKSNKLPDSVVTIEKKDHSRKPFEFYSLIEQLYPHGPHMELFARSKRKHWKAVGNEV